MRAIAALASIASLFVAGSAGAETKRVRIPIDAIPRQDTPMKVDGKNAVLPDGARPGSPAPKSWTVSKEGAVQASAHCTDDRRASVGLVSADQASASKIWEADGKVFYDRSYIRLTAGMIEVVDVSRTPVVYVGESMWAYRQKDAVVLVVATDVGMTGRADFFECSLTERSVVIPAGATTIESSPDDATTTMRYLLDSLRTSEAAPRSRAVWPGVAFKALATVSKASADPQPMLNIVIIKP